MPSRQVAGFGYARIPWRPLQQPPSPGESALVAAKFCIHQVPNLTNVTREIGLQNRSQSPGHFRLGQ